VKKILLSLASVACMAFIACGGGNDNSGSSNISRAGSPVTEFVIGNGTEIQSIDPSQIKGVPEHRVNIALFEGLVTYDSMAQIVPGVAESWTFSEDNTVITFTIRNGVTWSDGEPITAQTVVDSWLHHLNPTTASDNAYLMGMIVKGAADFNEGRAGPEAVAIRAIDSRHFEVTLVGPVAFALDMMAHYSFSPLPMHTINRYGTAWTTPANFVGSGPFLLQEWIPNDRLIVTKNERYWNRDNVHLNRVKYLPIEDTNTAYLAFRNGELDWSATVPVQLIEELQLRNDFHVSPLIGTYYLYMNIRHPILSDPRIRKALAISFDRQELINRVIRGGQIPAYGIVAPDGTDYPLISSDGFYDVPRAQALLAEAGFPGGVGLPTFTYIYNTSDLHRLIGEYLQETWRNNIGVNINLQNLEWATYLEMSKAPSMEISRAGWTADYADPQAFLELLITGGGNNDGQYSDPEFDRLLRQAASMPRGPERTNIMRQAEDIAILRDQAVIPVYYYVSQNLIDLNKWDGWETNPKNIHTLVGIRRK